MEPDPSPSAYRCKSNLLEAQSNSGTKAPFPHVMSHSCRGKNEITIIQAFKSSFREGSTVSASHCRLPQRRGIAVVGGLGMLPPPLL